MPNERENLLKYANLKRSRGGVLTADRYFRSIEGCYGGGDFCPAKLFDMHDESEWRNKLDEAEYKLVYSNSEMDVKEFKSFEKAKGGPVMQFDAIITSTKQDRDRDVLETKGATIDPKSPLLWQHIPMSPIGAFVGKLHHTEDMLSARFTIADTELGRDAATLIEAGALRISHGFEPKKFKPLKGEEGWLIEEFEIFEVSVVSIPSNTDAVITAFSREKLHCPLVKQWAKSMHDARPVMVAGADIEEESDVEPVEEPSQPIKSIRNGDYEETYYPPCSCQKAASKDVEPVDIKGIPAGCYSLPKSYEWIRESLHMGLDDICADVRGWSWVFATYKDHAIVCVEHSNGNVETFKANWGFTKGTPTWTSELVEVDIEVEATVIEKSRDMSKQKTYANALAYTMLCNEESELKSLKAMVDAKLEAIEHEKQTAAIQAENEQLAELLS